MSEIPLPFEERFRSANALEAARKFAAEAVSTGLTIRLRNNVVTAIEFDDPYGVAPFSIIANDAHALIYLRRSALTKFRHCSTEPLTRLGT